MSIQKNPPCDDRKGADMCSTPNDALNSSTLQVHYSRGKSKFDNAPEQRTAGNFDEFEESFLADKANKKGELYYCGPLTAGPHNNTQKYPGNKTWRLAELAQPRCFMAFDCDGFDKPETHECLLGVLAPRRGFSYTTASHKPEAPRCRVILSLSRNVSREEGIALGRALQKKIDDEIGVGKIMWDESVYRAEQPLFAPLQGSESVCFDGAPVDVDEILASSTIPPANKTPVEKNVSDRTGNPGLERYRMALTYIKPNPASGDYSYDTWITKVGMPLHFESQGSDEGFDIWNEWSARGDSYPGEEALRYKWGTFMPNKNQITTGATILALAREAGWVEDVSGDFESLGPESESISPEHDVRGNLIDPSAWQGKPVPVRQFLVEGLIPCREVILYTGHGGLGKSLTMQQLAVGCATGNNWLGLKTSPCKVFGLFCEENIDELHRRQDDIIRSLFLNHSDVKGRMTLLNAEEIDPVLMSFSTGNRTGRLSATFKNLENYLREFKPGLIILDTQADVFDGDEIARIEVKNFIRKCLYRLAHELNATVILCAHPSQSGMSSGEGDFSSKAWHNTVRSRLYLQESGDHPDERVLTNKKQNYGKKGFEIRMRWQNGVFTRFTSGSEPPEVIEEVKTVILNALDTYTTRQEPCSNLQTARNYLIRKMAENDLLGGTSEKLAGRALQALVDTGELIPNAKLPWKNASRHQAQGLARKPLV